MSVESEEAKDALNQEVVPTVIQAKLSDEFADAIGEEHARRMQDLSPRQSYDILVDGKIKKYNRRKIRTRERKRIEILRQKFTSAVQNNSPKYPLLEDEIYQTMASLYLIDPATGEGMTEEDFGATEFEDLKQILNACAFRTERPIPLGK